MKSLFTSIDDSKKRQRLQSPLKIVDGSSGAHCRLVTQWGQFNEYFQLGTTYCEIFRAMIFLQNLLINLLFNLVPIDKFKYLLLLITYYLLTNEINEKFKKLMKLIIIIIIIAKYLSTIYRI